MSDGSDGAGGVGNDGSSSTGNDTSTTDSLSGLSEAAAEAASELAGAVGKALGLDANSVSEAFSGLANALGQETQDLQNVVGAALVGAITGGLPGAIMGVANAMMGGSLTEAARDTVSKSLPESLQPFANTLIGNFAGRIPGANTSIEGALASFASGALTSGRAPDIADIGAISRAFNDLQSIATGVMSGQLDLSSPQAALSSLETALDTGLLEGSGIVSEVADRFARSGVAHVDGGRGTFGDAVETLAVDVARTLATRG